MRVPKDVIEDIIQRIDLKEYAETRGLAFKSGKACCPFHEDSTPSFSIPNNEQYFRCFGCEVSGDVISFIMRFDNATFIEALNIAAKYAGVSLPDEEFMSREEIEAREIRERLNKVYSVAAAYMHKVLPKDLREHLNKNYGMEDDFIDFKQVGYDDGNVYNYLLNVMGIPEQDLLMSGLFVKIGKKAKDFFETRLVFWYWRRGNPVYAIGRETEYTKALEGYEKYEADRKYKKLLTYDEEKRPYISREVGNKFIYNDDVFTNSFNRPSYGVITEGITDAMLAEQKGIPVMSPVTKQFRKDDIERLKQISRHVPTIYLVNDNEENESGLKGAISTAKELSEVGVNPYVTVIPRPKGVEKVDLNDLLKSIQSEQEFLGFLQDNSKNYLDFMVERASECKEEGNEPKYREMIDEVLVESKNMKPMVQEEFFKSVAKKTGTRIGAVREQYKHLLEEDKKKPEKKSTSFEELVQENEEESDAHKLYRALLDRGGKFFRSGGMESTDVIMILDGNTYSIRTEESPFTLYIQHHFNMNFHDHTIKKMIFEVKSMAYYNSARIKKQSWLFSDKQDPTLYLPLGFEETNILRIKPNEIKVVNNGQDNGVFVNNPGEVMEPWQFNPDVDRETILKELIDCYITLSPSSTEESLMVLLSVLAQPFKRYVDTIPIIKVHGASGSGKTQAARTPVLMLYGNEEAIGTMTSASLFDEADRRPVTVLDNLEKLTGELVEQFLLYSSTRGVRQIRDKSKNSGTIRQFVDSMAILTAIHPFEKTELINRSFDIHASKRFHKDPERVIRAEHTMNQKRDDFLSAWVLSLQDCLGTIDTLIEKRAAISKRYPTHSKERLNPFFALMWHLAESFLVHAGWKKKDLSKLVFGWIDSQSAKGSEQEKDISHVFLNFSMIAQYIRNETYKDFLDDVLEFADNVDGKIVIEASAQQLLTVFFRVSKENGQRLPFTNSQQLMSRITSEKELLEENGWVVKTRNRRGKDGSYIHYFSCPIEVMDSVLSKYAEVAATDWKGEEESWS